MAVPYRLLKTGGQLPKNKELRIVPDERGTVGIKRMGINIEKATAMTMADIVGVLEALKSEMVMQLMDGHRVHVRGLGYFSLSLGGDPYEDPRTHKLRLRNPYVRTINFLPEKDLLRELRHTEFENATYLYEAYNSPTPEEVIATLKQLFARSTYILVSDLRSALHLSKPVSYRLARRLEAEGKIKNIGSPQRKIFVKGKEL